MPQEKISRIPESGLPYSRDESSYSPANFLPNKLQTVSYCDLRFQMKWIRYCVKEKKVNRNIAEE